MYKPGEYNKREVVDDRVLPTPIDDRWRNNPILPNPIDNRFLDSSIDNRVLPNPIKDDNPNPKPK